MLEWEDKKKILAADIKIPALLGTMLC